MAQYPFWTAAGVILADQLVKAAASAKLDRIYSASPGSIGFCPAVNAENTYSPSGRLAALLILLACAIFIGRYQSPAKDFRLRLGMGLVVGGALSNNISWIFQGYVVDYLSVSGSDTEIIINLADLAYISGVVLYISGAAREIQFMIKERLLKRKLTFHRKET